MFRDLIKRIRKKLMTQESAINLFCFKHFFFFLKSVVNVRKEENET